MQQTLIKSKAQFQLELSLAQFSPSLFFILSKPSNILATNDQFFTKLYIYIPEII